MLSSMLAHYSCVEPYDMIMTEHACVCTELKMYMRLYVFYKNC